MYQDATHVKDALVNAHKNMIRQKVHTHETGMIDSSMIICLIWASNCDHILL